MAYNTNYPSVITFNLKTFIGYVSLLLLLFCSSSISYRILSNNINSTKPLDKSTNETIEPRAITNQSELIVGLNIPIAVVPSSLSLAEFISSPASAVFIRENKTTLRNVNLTISGPSLLRKISSSSSNSSNEGAIRQESWNSKNLITTSVNPVILRTNRRRQFRSLRNKDKKNDNVKKKTLTILGLFELSQNNLRRESGESERAAAQLALDDINKNDNILPGYQLTMHTNDTQCDPGAGVDAFFHALYMRKDSKIISLLGTACSEVTERLAKVATHQRIVQVSFGSTSPSLSDRKEFPLFYRTVAPVSSHAEAIIELIRHFNWDTVSFFTKNENRFTMPVNHLVKELEEKGNITCKATLTFSISDFRDQLQDMKDLDSRIIIANFGPDVAPLVFCEVYRMGMYGRDYAWILIGKPVSNWWKERSSLDSLNFNPKSRLNSSLRSQKLSSSSSESNSSKINERDNLVGTLRTRGKVNGKFLYKPECSLKQLTQAIENTLVVDRHNVLDRVSDYGITTDSKIQNFVERLRGSRNTSLKKPISTFAGESYDAVYAIAIGLHKIQNKYNYTLEHFDYMDDEFSHSLNEEIGQLNFTGISGPITFSGSDRIGITSFMQIQGGSMVQVGLLHPDRQANKLELSTCVDCRSIQWPGNQVPIARREFRIKLIRVEDSLYIIVASVAFLGIVMAATFLAFNLYYRKLKYIKLSSPRLNNMVIIGCIFAYVAVILLGSDFPVTETDGKRFAYICSLRAYLLSTAFSLSYGAMFAKTFRVHRIFTRSCIGVVKNKLLRDTQLMTLIIALVLIDVIIVTSWAVFDPMHRNLRNLTLEIDPSDRSVVYQPQIEICSSQHGHVWLSIMYGYKSLLLVVGLYMAWETRHVKIQALNDSKNIAYCVYIVVLTSVLAVSLANLISERVTLSFVSVTSLILISTTVTLCLLFLPKIHSIKTGGYKGDPVVESSGLKIEFNTRRLVVEDAKELMFRAEVQNRVYKRQIQAIDVEIWRLENLLLCSSHASLASLENLSKLELESRGNAKEPSSTGGTSSEDNSEIYTVYLHGPRFIVPISVFNFQNPNALAPSSTINQLTTPSTPGITPSAPPRSSWPNIRSLLAPSNGLIAKKYRFKSEPKLVIEELENDTATNSSDMQLLTSPIPKVTGGVSDETLMLPKISYAQNLRKGSNTSCGGGVSSTKRSSLLDVLKHPLAYFTGVIRSSGGSPSSNAQMENDLSPSPSDPPIFHLSVPRDSVRQKYSSVPDLWGVRTSPILELHRKKTSILSDSVVDTSSLHYNLSSDKPRGLSISNPILQLTVTSDESPYL